MKYITILIVFLITISFTSIGASITPEYQYLTIQSKALKTELKVTIHLPEDYDKSSIQKYPVLYTVDAKYYIDHVRAITSSLSANYLMPQVIVVGIDSDNRMRDYTPTKVGDIEHSGGADKFLDFIEQELMPEIESKFKTSGFNIFSGHSLGGLLSLHAFYKKPQLFNAHFALSPSLYWDNRKTMRAVKSYLKKSTELNQFLYINMGDEGLDGGTAKSKSMRQGFIELQNFLSNHTNTEKFWSVTEHLENETHMSTTLIGIFKASRTLYRNWQLPFRISEQGIEAIEKRYQSLSKDLFHEIKPTEGMINYHARYLMHIGQPDKSIKFYEYNVERFPDSSEAQFNLASAYKKVNRLSLAKIHAELALDLTSGKSEQRQRYQALLNGLKNF